MTDQQLQKTEPVQQMTVGRHNGMSEERYHALPYCSQSRLKKIDEFSPMHCLHEMMHPTEPTAAMKLGTALHTAVLYPSKFDAEYDKAGPCRGKLKAGGDCSSSGSIRSDGKWYCKTHAPAFRDKGIKQMSRDDYDTTVAMMNAINAHDSASKLLNVGPMDREVTIVWMDETTHAKPDGDGLLCKCRLDVWKATANPHTGLIVDIKSCPNASPGEFATKVKNMKYHFQAAMYVQGAMAIGLDVQEFCFVAVESKPPYAVATYLINSEQISQTMPYIQHLKEQFAACKAKSGTDWRGYSNAMQELFVSEWEMKRITRGTL